MNRAQKLLQPLIDAARDKYNKTPEGGLDYDMEDMAEATVSVLDEASETLATLTDDITLADVPAVDWETRNDNEYAYGEWLIWKSGTGVYCADARDEAEMYYANLEQCKRGTEIRIHLAALERKLLAELVGGK